MTSSSRPRLLDLFSGAGGAAAGYEQAGFEVVGVDLVEQPRFPYEFVQGDALEYLEAHGREFDVIHASPPCQRFSSITKMHGAERVAAHPSLIGPTRELLLEIGVPYVIENVVGARAELRSPVLLCGSMYGLKAGELHLRRHRLFESQLFLWPPASCAHLGQALGVYGHAGGRSIRDGLSFSGTDSWREGMGISWMTGAELAEAIPPAYTEWIGSQIRQAAGW